MAVFSHHHIDHVFGTARFEVESAERGWTPPVVYGHEAMPAISTVISGPGVGTRPINKRQFGLPVDTFSWPADFRRPDVTYSTAMTVSLGELTVELHHARGETDDATWTWVPEPGCFTPVTSSSTRCPTPATPRRSSAT